MASHDFLGGGSFEYPLFLYGNAAFELNIRRIGKRLSKVLLKYRVKL
jgi:hypothetical protein